MRNTYNSLYLSLVLCCLANALVSAQVRESTGPGLHLQIFNAIGHFQRGDRIYDKLLYDFPWNRPGQADYTFNLDLDRYDHLIFAFNFDFKNKEDKVKGVKDLNFVESSQLTNGLKVTDLVSKAGDYLVIVAHQPPPRESAKFTFSHNEHSFSGEINLTWKARSRSIANLSKYITYDERIKYIKPEWSIHIQSSESLPDLNQYQNLENFGPLFMVKGPPYLIRIGPFKDPETAEETKNRINAMPDKKFFAEKIQIEPGGEAEPFIGKNVNWKVIGLNEFFDPEPIRPLTEPPVVANNIGERRNDVALQNNDRERIILYDRPTYSPSASRHSAYPRPEAGFQVENNYPNPGPSNYSAPSSPSVSSNPPANRPESVYAQELSARSLNAYRQNEVVDSYNQYLAPQTGNQPPASNTVLSMDKATYERLQARGLLPEENVEVVASNYSKSGISQPSSYGQVAVPRGEGEITPKSSVQWSNVPGTTVSPQIYSSANAQRGTYAIQLAAYRVFENAQSQLQRWQQAGLSTVYLLETNYRGGVLYKVLIGHFVDKDTATSELARSKRELPLDAFVVGF